MNTQLNEIEIKKMLLPISSIYLLEEEVLRKELIKIVNSLFELIPSVKSVQTRVQVMRTTSDKLVIVKVNGEDVPRLFCKESRDSFLFSSFIKDDEYSFLWDFLHNLEFRLRYQGRAMFILRDVLNNYKRE